MNRIPLLAVLLASMVFLTASGLQGSSEDNGTMPTLTFVEVLEVVAIGVHMEKEMQIRREPALKAIMRDAEQSLGGILNQGLLQPEAVFSTLQSDLSHHDARIFAIFIQSFWEVMDLYEVFYRLNADLYDAGVRMPFHSFLTAIHRGLSEEGSKPVFIAGDGGQVNPLNMIRERELVFVSW